MPDFPCNECPDRGAISERLRSIEDRGERIEKQVTGINGSVRAHQDWISSNQEKLMHLQDTQAGMLEQLAEHQSYVDKGNALRETFLGDMAVLKKITGEHGDYIKTQQGGQHAVSRIGAIVAGLCTVILVIFEIVKAVKH